MLQGWRQPGGRGSSPCVLVTLASKALSTAAAGVERPSGQCVGQRMICPARLSTRLEYELELSAGLLQFMGEMWLSDRAPRTLGESDELREYVGQSGIWSVACTLP